MLCIETSAKTRQGIVHAFEELVQKVLLRFQIWGFQNLRGLGFFSLVLMFWRLCGIPFVAGCYVDTTASMLSSCIRDKSRKAIRCIYTYAITNWSTNVVIYLGYSFAIVLLVQSCLWFVY